MPNLLNICSSYEDVAPEKSYIQTSDFENPKELARYLEYLVTNETAFNEYFWWEDHYKSLKFSTLRLTNESDMKLYTALPDDLKLMCKFCKALNDELEPKSYPDFHDWWFKQSNCDLSNTHRVYNFYLKSLSCVKSQASQNK